jgi:hypothetical protein
MLFLLGFVKTSYSQQWNGLTLYSNSGSTLGYLIDTNSTVVKTWTFTGGNTGYSTHMTPGGDIYRSVANTGNVLTGGGMTGKIQKYNYSGTLLWDYTYSSSTYCLHHDHCPLPNGNILVICYEVKTPTEVSNAGATMSITVWSEKIMELKPTGLNTAAIVWQWNLWDHLVQNVNSSKANYQTSITDNPQLLNINYNLKKDWLHMNGIDYNPFLDQIVVSSHNLNQWFIIDHSTTAAEAAGHTGGNSGKGGDFLYRYGNPASYAVNTPTVLNVTHDAHWIPEGYPNEGFLAGLNNKAVTSPANKTSVDQISVPRVNYNYTITPGSAYTPTNYINRHLSTGYTSNMGSSDQFPNGNQMVCLATAGTIYEIDAAGNVLWTKTTSGVTPQAHRYSSCYINNAAPNQPTISLISNDLVSNSATTYQWYLNGNLITGANNQTYTPTQSGIYVVRTTDNNGCVYVYSSGYNYSLLTSIKTNNGVSNYITVFPNPTNGRLELNLNGINDKNFTITLLDNTGKVVYKIKNETIADISHLDSGIYILNLTTSDNVSINKKITLIK